MKREICDDCGEKRMYAVRDNCTRKFKYYYCSSCGYQKSKPAIEKIKLEKLKARYRESVVSFNNCKKEDNYDYKLLEGQMLGLKDAVIIMSRRFIDL